MASLLFAATRSIHNIKSGEMTAQSRPMQPLKNKSQDGRNIIYCRFDQALWENIKTSWMAKVPFEGGKCLVSDIWALCKMSALLVRLIFLRASMDLQLWATMGCIFGAGWVSCTTLGKMVIGWVSLTVVGFHHPIPIDIVGVTFHVPLLF